MNYLIITAGGNSSRMKSAGDKIFSILNGRPLIYWTLRIFEACNVIDGIIISAKKKNIKKIGLIIKKNKFKKIMTIIEADGSRQESIFKVLKWLKSKISKNDMVGVHNAVNLFVTDEEIGLVYDGADNFKAALLAHPAKDTVKIGDDKHTVEFTPLRKFSWYAQTPQVAGFGDLWDAYMKADRDKFTGTDDTQLLERMGIKAKIVPCSRLNFKITYPEDLILAEEILKVFFK